MSNVQNLKDAYKAWHDTKGGSAQTWLDLMHDHVTYHTMFEKAAGLNFAKDGTTKEDVVAYLSGIFDEWNMIHWTAEDFVTEGNQVAVFGYCAFRNKATQNIAQVRVGHLWTFEDDKIMDFIEIFDSARAAAAATATEVSADTAAAAAGG